MSKIISVLTYPIKAFLIFLVYLYKILISPLLPKSCRFIPSCSTYCVTAIKRFGIVKGVFYTFKRLIRCNSKNTESRIDPVLDNIKGDIKWLI